jgi:hypothetical protein
MKSNDIFITLKKRKNVWILPGFTLLFCVISFAFVVIPQVADVFAVREQKEAASLKLDALQSKRVSLSQISADELDEQLQSLEYVLPRRKPVLELLALLESFSLDTEVVLREYEFNPGQLATESAKPSQAPLEDKTGTQEMVVALVVEGTFEAIQLFYEEIESMGPLSQLAVVSQTLLMDPFAQDSTEKQEAKITLNVQHAPYPEKLGDIEAKVAEFSGKDLDALEKAESLQTVADIEDQSAVDVAPAVDRPNPFSF